MSFLRERLEIDVRVVPTWIPHQARDNREKRLKLNNQMNIEYEATFINIDKDEIRNKLKNAGAKLVRPEFLQKRVAFYLSGHEESNDRFARVRDEGDKITMTIKLFDGDKIDNQKEINLVINDFESGVKFLEAIGCSSKSYQETKRELWKLENVEIMIDTWPFLEPIVEVEGNSEEEVMTVSKKLGFDYDKAKFCSVDVIYREKYNLPTNVINTAPKLIFEMKNPFINN